MTNTNSILLVWYDNNKTVLAWEPYTTNTKGLAEVYAYIENNMSCIPRASWCVIDPYGKSISIAVNSL